MAILQVYTHSTELPIDSLGVKLYSNQPTKHRQTQVMQRRTQQAASYAVHSKAPNNDILILTKFWISGTQKNHHEVLHLKTGQWKTPEKSTISYTLCLRKKTRHQTLAHNFPKC